MLSEEGFTVSLRNRPNLIQLPASHADEVSEMNATALRLGVPSRFRRGPRRPTVENLMDQIRELTAERQLLRDGGASNRKLERNRVKLARTQWELSHALIERYLPAAVEQHAA
jgi:hypothetical protein